MSQLKVPKLIPGEYSSPSLRVTKPMQSSRRVTSSRRSPNLFEDTRSPSPRKMLSKAVSIKGSNGGCGCSNKARNAGGAKKKTNIKPKKTKSKKISK